MSLWPEVPFTFKLEASAEMFDITLKKVVKKKDECNSVVCKFGRRTQCKFCNFKKDHNYIGSKKSHFWCQIHSPE